MNGLPSWVAWALGITASIVTIAASALQIQAIRNSKPGPLGTALQLGKLTRRLVTGNLTGKQLFQQQAVRPIYQSVQGSSRLDTGFSSSGHTLVVGTNNFQGAAFNRIDDALKACSPGDQIILQPGSYHIGYLNVDIPVEIIGQGESGDALIWARAIRFTASSSRLANVTIHGTEPDAVLELLQGNAVIEDCDISNEAGACVRISNSANPILRRNKIHHGRCGVLVTAHGRGQLESNDIFAQTGSAYSDGAGVRVDGFGSPILRNNTVHANDYGVLVEKVVRTIVQGNTIVDNRIGMHLYDAHVTVTGNRITNNEVGVEIRTQCKGLLENNDLRNNRSRDGSVDPRQYGLQVKGNKTDRSSFAS